MRRVSNKAVHSGGFSFGLAAWWEHVEPLGDLDRPSGVIGGWQALTVKAGSNPARTIFFDRDVDKHISYAIIKEDQMGRLEKILKQWGKVESLAERPIVLEQKFDIFGGVYEMETISYDLLYKTELTFEMTRFVAKGLEHPEDLLFKEFIEEFKHELFGDSFEKIRETIREVEKYISFDGYKHIQELYYQIDELENL
jgi:hypothetical protein